MSYKNSVVLTGGVATGKSTVASLMREFGLEIIDADEIAHEVLDDRSDDIARMFGPELVSNNKVDRKTLGKIVFGDEVKRRKLEKLVHPLIEQAIKDRADKLDKLSRPYLIDIPLFFEKETYPIERVIVVYAPRELQIERLMERNGLSRKEALQRIDAQIDIETKRDRATYLIDNLGDTKQLKAKCKRVYEKIMDDFARR